MQKVQFQDQAKGKMSDPTQSPGPSKPSDPSQTPGTSEAAPILSESEGQTKISLAMKRLAQSSWKPGQMLERDLAQRIAAELKCAVSVVYQARKRLSEIPIETSIPSDRQTESNTGTAAAFDPTIKSTPKLKSETETKIEETVSLPSFEEWIKADLIGYFELANFGIKDGLHMEPPPKERVELCAEWLCRIFNAFKVKKGGKDSDIEKYATLAFGLAAIGSTYYPYAKVALTPKKKPGPQSEEKK